MISDEQYFKDVTLVMKALTHLVNETKEIKELISKQNDRSVKE